MPVKPRRKRLLWVASSCVFAIIVGFALWNVLDIRGYWIEQRCIREIQDWERDPGTANQAVETLGKMASLRGLPAMLLHAGWNLRLNYWPPGDRLSLDDEFMVQAAVEEVLEAKPATAVARLVDLLADSDPELRRRAALWLRGSGHLALPHLGRLRHYLNDTDPVLRLELAWVLWELGEDVRTLAPIAAGLLGHSTCSASASQLLLSLERFEGVAAALAARVREAAKTRLPDYRAGFDPNPPPGDSRPQPTYADFDYNAEEALSRLGGPALEYALPLLTDSCADVREAGVRVVCELAGLVAAEDEASSRAAVDCAKHVLPLAKDPAENVRVQVLTYLVCLPPTRETVTPILLAALRDGREAEAKAALASIESLGKADREVCLALCDLLGKEPLEMAVLAAECLAELGSSDPEVEAALLEATESRDSGLRLEATRALCLLSIDSPRTLPRLQALAGDQARAENNVRGARLWALTALFHLDRIAEGVWVTEAKKLIADGAGSHARRVLEYLGPKGRGLVPFIVQARLKDAPGSGGIGALAKVGTSREVLLPLVEGLREPVVRGSTRYEPLYDQLFRLGPAAGPVVPELAALLLEGDERAALFAAGILSGIGLPAAGAAVPDLVKAHFQARTRTLRFWTWDALRTLLGRDWLRKPLP